MSWLSHLSGLFHAVHVNPQAFVDLGQEHFVGVALSESVLHGGADISTELTFAKLESSVDEIAQVGQQLGVVLQCQVVPLEGRVRILRSGVDQVKPEMKVVTNMMSV